MRNVTEIQQRLIDLGFLSPGGADGVFGTVTLMALNRFLIGRLQQGLPTLLIVDEAQNLSAEMLEEIRLLSNLETPTSKLIQIMLVGQPELNDMLARPDLRQLRQRIVQLEVELHTIAERAIPDVLAERRLVAAAAELPTEGDL